MKDYIVSIIVVDPDQLAEFAKANGLDASDDAILEDPKLRQQVMNSISKLSEEKRLLRQERVN